MLGPVEPGGPWRWIAVGKHPVAKDYVRLGHLSPFADGFADWVRNGYRNLNLKEKIPFSAFRSWRFWARGFGKDALACGVLRDSSDAIGRQYPFLVMGNGPMKGWEELWDLLPLACEKTWSQMEYLCTQRVEDIDRLQREVQDLTCPPLPDRSDPSGRGERLGEGDWAGVSGRREILIALNPAPGGDPFALAALWTNFMKHHENRIPGSLFIGGTSETAYLAAFHRPLTPSDFVQLWSV